MDCPNQVEHAVGLSSYPLLLFRTGAGTRLTVRDVLELARSDELIDIRNLGPLRVAGPGPDHRASAGRGVQDG